MASLSSNSVYEWHIPASAEETFNALVEAVGTIFVITNADDFTLTVQFVTKASALTWGDRASAQVIREGENCKIRVTAASRNAQSGLVAGKLEMNMQSLLSEVSKRLKAKSAVSNLQQNEEQLSVQGFAEKIRGLKELVEIGVISEDEFLEKKKLLLDEI